MGAQIVNIHENIIKHFKTQKIVLGQTAGVLHRNATGISIWATGPSGIQMCQEIALWVALTPAVILITNVRVSRHKETP